MMTGLSLGKVFGVKIELHWSTLLIVFLVAQGVMEGFIPMRHPGISFAANICVALVTSVLFITSILAHELAHARIGQMYGIRFQGITLFALGGMAKMNSKIPSAKSEFWMALAGPASSIIIGLICLALYFPDNGRQSIMYTSNSSILIAYSYFATVMMYIGFINVMLGIFNGCIPAFPLDSGRILRSIIWGITKNYKLATLWCANIGKIFAGVFAFIGILMTIGINIPFFGTGIVGGIWMFVIALFLFGATTAEIMAVKKDV